MNKKRILVTGANGYIGSHVVKFLTYNGFDVIACDIMNDKLDENIKFVNLDILKECEETNLFSKLGKPTHVIHLAWQDGFIHNAVSHIDNLPKHFFLLKNLIQHGVKSVAVMGTMHEVGYVEGIIREDTLCNPLNFYGIAKNSLRQAILLYAKEKNVSIKWLRAYYIYGDDKNNHSIFTKLIEAEEKGDKIFPFTDGTNFYDFIHIDELAKLISLASIQNKIEGIINVCSGIPITLKDKVEEYIKEHNFKIKLQIGGFPKRKYDSPIVYGDDSKIKSIIEKAMYKKY